MLLKNIVIGALMAIPALASANSLTETRERMAIEQQAIAYTVSQKWDKLDAMFQEYNTGFRQPAAELINWLSHGEGSIIFFSRCFRQWYFWRGKRVA